MKRWTLRILLLLILGAITTVAVAWGLSTYGTLRQHKAIATELWFGDQRWLYGVVRYRGVGRERLWLSDQLEPFQGIPEGGRWVGDRMMHGPWGPFDYERLPHWSDIGYHASQEPHTVFDQEASGWPLRALTGVFFTTYPGNESATNLRAGSLLPAWVRGADDRPYLKRFIALGPIWPGFAINTLFYAAIWFGVFFGFTSAKRFIRAKRGRCPRCGYDLRGGVMSDKRLVISGEIADGVDPLSTQNSARSTSLGCPECGWGRENAGTPKR